MKTQCPNCHHRFDEEEVEILKKFGPWTCPTCGVEGCEQCIFPLGRGSECLSCEEEGDED